MFAKVNGRSIFYEVVGEGLPIVLVHGLGGTSNVWNAQRAALSRYFRVVTLDLPGSGRSDGSQPEYSMDGWAEDLTGLADAARLDKFVLVGHSMTTVLAQRFAARHGDRLTALVLAGPITELPPAAKEVFNKRIEAVQKDGMIGVADTVLSGALSAATREANSTLAGLYRDMLLSNDPTCYIGHCRALMAGSAKDDQPRIKCPTLVLVGDQDPVTPLASARQVAAAIRGSRLRIIPGTAHMTMLERPESFNTALVEFIAEV